MREDELVPASDGGEETERFEYLESPDAPFVPSWSGWENAPDAAGDSGRADGGGRMAAHRDKPGGRELERRLIEEARRSFEAGRMQGREEGRKAERDAEAEARAAKGQEKIRQTAALIEQFAAEREQYFHAAEAEVVRLALAVAARILRREAASDPLLLMGAVRVALGQISAAAEVRLRVPPAELDLWTEAIALLPNLAAKPAVLPGEGMTLGECRIETALGTADLGVRAQLAEVERALLANPSSARKDVQPARSGLAGPAAESAA